MTILGALNKTDNSIDTLNLKNLLARPGWEDLSVENILELANKGFFGLYCNFSKITGSSQRKTYKRIGEYKNDLVKNKFIEESERNTYLELSRKLGHFVKANKALLRYKVGYVRLATAMEVEAFPFCESGSINRLQEESRIENVTGDNNYFGFVFLGHKHRVFKRSIVSPAYHLYTRKITQEALVVFIDHIEAFENKIEQSLNNLKFYDANSQEKLDEALRKFSLGRIKANKGREEEAEIEWEKCLSYALEVAKKNPKKYSAQGLAIFVLHGSQIFRRLGKMGTLRKKISQDPRFFSYLKGKKYSDKS